MATLTAVDPLVEELMRTEGKAEIVGGRVVLLTDEYIPLGAVTK